jgi:hypothetical protein
MNETRHQSKAALLARLAQGGDAAAATDYWFSEETQREMHRLVARLK